MNDLIRRQDVIDMLAEMQGRCTSKTALIQNSKIWQQIKDLPSAQAAVDGVEVVRCKDCKHGRLYKWTDKYVECKMDVEPIDRDSNFFCADGERKQE